MSVFVAPIVEGHGEVVSVPPLLHRVWNELFGNPARLEVLQPYLAKQGQLHQPNGLVLGIAVQKAFVNLQAKRQREPDSTGLVLLVLDAEKECPARLGPSLLNRARMARPDATIACVLAKRMFENWLVAGAGTLGGVNGLPAQLRVPPLPEDVGGKAWFDQLLRTADPKRPRGYSETRDCFQFVRRMDLTAARTADSFDKLCREVANLLPLPPPPPPINPLSGGESS